MKMHLNDEGKVLRCRAGEGEEPYGCPFENNMDELLEKVQAWKEAEERGRQEEREKEEQEKAKAKAKAREEAKEEARRRAQARARRKARYNRDRRADERDDKHFSPEDNSVASETSETFTQEELDYIADAWEALREQERAEHIRKVAEEEAAAKNLSPKTVERVVRRARLKRKSNYRTQPSLRSTRLFDWGHTPTGRVFRFIKWLAKSYDRQLNKLSRNLLH